MPMKSKMDLLVKKKTSFLVPGEGTERVKGN